MTGTEKQIAWAEDIIETIEKTSNIVIDAYKAKGIDIGDTEKSLEKMLENLNKSYAGYVIEDFKNCYFESYDGVKDEAIANRNFKKLNDALMSAKIAGRNYFA